MKNELNILLPIETSQRELYSKVYIAYSFALRDCSCYVGSKQNINTLPKYLKKCIYFDKGYHEKVSEKLFDSLRQYNVKIVSLDEENAVDTNKYRTLNKKFTEKSITLYDNIYLWGKIQFQYLKEKRKNFNKSNIYITGHPRFELLKKKYLDLYSQKVNEYKKIYGNFILINTSFGKGNNVLGDDIVLKKYNGRLPNIQKYIDYEKKLVDDFVELAIFLSINTSFNIIIRPHPEEDTELYKSKIQNYSNIHIISKESVIPWILASNIMIHHDCTTSLEAAMLGKTSIAYTKNLDTDLATVIPLLISYKYETLDSILEHILAIKNRNYINSQILEDYFSFSLDSLSIIIDKTINDCSFNDECSVNNKKIKMMFNYKVIQNAKYLINYILSRYDKLFIKKIEDLRFENIQTSLKYFNKLNDTTIKLKKINRFLYKIKK